MKHRNAMTDEQMDALIAEKVMGWRDAITENCSGVPFKMWIGDAVDQREQCDWHPSIDLNHAFEALEKWLMCNQHSYCMSRSPRRDTLLHEVTLYGGLITPHIFHESPATAICMALIEACGVEA